MDKSFKSGSTILYKKNMRHRKPPVAHISLSKNPCFH